MNTLINLENTDYLHYTLCYVDKKIFPHAGVSVLLDVAIINNHIEQIVKQYGVYSVNSKQYLTYFKFYPEKFKNSPGYIISRINLFDGQSYSDDLMKTKTVNQISVIVEDLIAMDNKEYGVKIDLTNLYVFSENIPDHMKSILVSEDQVITVEPWLARIPINNYVTVDEDCPEISKINNRYFVKLRKNTAIVYDLIGKVVDLLPDDLQSTVFRLGFYNLDLLSIKKDQLRQVAKPIEKYDEFQNMSHYDFDASIHPMLKMYDSIYKNVAKEIDTFQGATNTTENREKLARTLISTMKSYDIYVDKSIKTE